MLSNQTKPPAGSDLLRDVKGDVLDLRPIWQKGKSWNLGDLNRAVRSVVFDPREASEACHRIWFDCRRQLPSQGKCRRRCVLFCTVLYHEQIRRGAWFLHDLSGDASQLSLPFMIRLECRHDVVHARGDARGRWGGERASFLTKSPDICRRVDGSIRENLDSEICGGRSQHVGDVETASSICGSRRRSATSSCRWRRSLPKRTHPSWA